MDRSTLLAAVATEFVRTGAATATWPDPHEGMTGPRDEEYSRVLDPRKYAIVGARVSAWADALLGTGLAVADWFPDSDLVWREPREDRRPAQVTCLRPRRAGTVPLVFAVRSVLADDDNVVIGVGEPAVPLARVPDCGCDACDGGSTRLLERLDDTVLSIVGGGFVHIAGDGGTLHTTGSGWSSSGQVPGVRRGDYGAIDGLLADARSGRSDHPVLHGRAWW